MAKWLNGQMVRYFLLIVIVLLAGFLRVYKLDQYPAGLNADEAAIGYNAYSLIQTGKDEHGNPWPIHFKSFGDYKPGLYFYLVLPFVKVLGLNIWAVRLPSAILGVLGVLGVYWLVNELFANSVHPKGVPSATLRVSLGLLSSLLLAISPWHIHFSRGGWEVNAATFFILWGTLMFLKGLRSSRFFIFHFSFFVFSMYTYHSARIIVPLLGLGLILIYRNKLLAYWLAKERKWFVFGVLLALVLLIPLIKDFLGPAGVSRFSGVGILADEGPYWRTNEQRGEHQNWNSFWVRILHNRPVYYGLSFLENWADHFHGEFLFLSGDSIQRNRVPETGQMYLVEVPFLVLGIWFLLKDKPKNYHFILWWLAVAPVAAALTFQTPHALRAHNMIIPLVIIMAYGLRNVLIWVKNQKKVIVSLFYCFIVSLFLLNFARYLHQYYVHYPQTYPAAWEYGFEELVHYVKGVQDQYDHIYVTDKYDQPYILFLFYLRYPPQRFQEEVVLTPRDKFGFSTVRNFDKYYFGEIKWEEMKETPKTLIIGVGSEIPDGVEVLKIINFPDGQPAFKISKT